MYIFYKVCFEILLFFTFLNNSISFISFIIKIILLLFEDY